MKEKIDTMKHKNWFEVVKLFVFIRKINFFYSETRFLLFIFYTVWF